LRVRSKELSLLYDCYTVHYRVGRGLSPGLVELAWPVVQPDAEGYNFT